MSIRDKWVLIGILSSVALLQVGSLRLSGVMIWLFMAVVPAGWIHVCELLITRSATRRYCLFYKITVLLMGPFATAGNLFLILFSPKERLVRDFREFTAVDIVFSPSERVELGLTCNYWETGEGGIVPFIDIMEGDNPSMKRSTINRVIQHPGPNSKRILDIGLRDENQETRFYAATALIMLNDSFISDFRKYQKRIEKTPNDPQSLLKLAIAYDQYCSWGLPEREDYERYYRKLKKIHEKILEISPQNIQSLIGLSRLLIQQKKMDAANEIIKEGLRVYPASPFLTVEFFKLLFYQKRFAELKERATQFINTRTNIALEIQEPTSFWVHRGEATE